MDVDAADDRQQEREELRVGVRVVARIEEVLARRRCAIDQLLCLPEPLMPANGFSWMRNIRPCCGASLRIVDITSMLWSEPTDVASNTGAISNCAGRDLVVARLGRDAQAPQLAVEIHHEREDPLADRAEVLVLQLLALGRRGAEQRAAGEERGRAAAPRAGGRRGSTPARARCS